MNIRFWEKIRKLENEIEELKGIRDSLEQQLEVVQNENLKNKDSSIATFYSIINDFDNKFYINNNWLPKKVLELKFFNRHFFIPKLFFK